MREQFVNIFIQNVENVVSPNISDEKKEAFSKALKDFTEKVVADKELNDAITDVYAPTFAEDEISKLKEFFSRR